ncbi:MAG: hypothetical protein ACFFAL_07275 [Promethearchaeota archaeon]
MNGYPDQEPPRKGWSQPETLIFAGILLFLFGVLFWLYGALQKQIYEALHPGLIVDIFPPIGILIFGIALCIVGIILREGNA